jgi:hypothetical protein
VCLRTGVTAWRRAWNPKRRGQARAKSWSPGVCNQAWNPKRRGQDPPVEVTRTAPDRSIRIIPRARVHDQLAAFRLRARGSHRRGSALGCFRLGYERRSFRSCTRITEPHEATALLTHWMVSIEEFGSEIGEGLVV